MQIYILESLISSKFSLIVDYLLLNFVTANIELYKLKLHLQGLIN